MSESLTIPKKLTGVPVRKISVEVRSGPQAGMRAIAEAEVCSVGTAQSNDIILNDPAVSRFHLELKRAGSLIQVVDHGSTNGTFIGPVLLRGQTVDIRPGTALEIGSSVLVVNDGEVLLVEAGPKLLSEIRGRSQVMRRLMATVERVAQSEVPLLILGESGTGKELVARALHARSSRSKEPFVTVNCGALSPTLFSSELFGHERGAFTGADRQHIGAFERAHKGTLFLDEVGELSQDLQVYLLGVLERSSFQRLGGHQEIRVDVRVLSATNRDLRADVNTGTFRLDLFYRLAVVCLDVPPLRERPEDIEPLIAHFLEQAGYNGSVDSLFTSDAIARLEQHRWPGNVRELRNLVLGSLALGQAPEMPSADVSPLTSDPVEAILHLSYREARKALLEVFQRRYLQKLLGMTGGNVRAAARKANMDRSYLMELLTRHGMR